MSEKGYFERVPRAALGVLYEIARHLLKRPVVGICAVARTADGRVLLVRRADTGTWALPGGTLEWGEQLRPAIRRELKEETGAHVVEIGRVTGIYSRPDRDSRFHAVTVCVTAAVEVPRPLKPGNSLEIREAQLFGMVEVPESLAMGMRDMLEDAIRESDEVVLE